VRCGKLCRAWRVEVGCPRVWFGFLLGLVLFAVGCRPAYTWQYRRAAHPEATAAYIRAVMAREAGDDALALHYYDEALWREDSSRVRAEREALIRRMQQ